MPQGLVGIAIYRIISNWDTYSKIGRTIWIIKNNIQALT